MDNRAAFAFAGFAAATLQDRAVVYIDRFDLGSAYPFLARSLERFEQAEAAAPDQERAAAQLRTGKALHEIGLRVIRTGRIESAYSFFESSMTHYAAALESAETREERVEARFGTTLNAIALHHSRRDVGDRWFSVGTLARPSERIGFYNRLTEVAAAHRSGGDVVAAQHAEGLARSVEATSPMAGIVGDRNVGGRIVGGRMAAPAVVPAAGSPAVWSTRADVRRTSDVFQSHAASSGTAAA